MRRQRLKGWSPGSPGASAGPPTPASLVQPSCWRKSGGSTCVALAGWAAPQMPVAPAPPGPLPAHRGHVPPARVHILGLDSSAHAQPLPALTRVTVVSSRFLPPAPHPPAPSFLRMSVALTASLPESPNSSPGRLSNPCLLLLASPQPRPPLQSDPSPPALPRPVPGCLLPQLGSHLVPLPGRPHLRLENTHNSGSPRFRPGPALITWPGRAPLWSWAPRTPGHRRLRSSLSPPPSSEVPEGSSLVPPRSLPSARGSFPVVWFLASVGLSPDSGE